MKHAEKRIPYQAVCTGKTGYQHLCVTETGTATTNTDNQNKESKGKQNKQCAQINKMQQKIINHKS